jgi:hypothetical protein
MEAMGGADPAAEAGQAEEDIPEVDEAVMASRVKAMKSDRRCTNLPHRRLG